jgi:hypothetical protein
MRSAQRIVTQRGLGPEEDEITDLDIVETDGVPTRSSMTCPPLRSSRPSSTSGASRSVDGTAQPSTYSFVAPRRQTPPMMHAIPLAAIECVSVSRRRTLAIEDEESCPPSSDRQRSA